MEVDYKAALLEILNKALVMYMGEYDEAPTSVLLDRWYDQFDSLELAKALVELHEEGLLPHAN